MSATASGPDATRARDAARAFRLPAPPTSAKPLGSGHIHDTWAVTCGDAPRPCAVLQRINARVFPDPHRVVENVARIAAHLAARHAGDPRAALHPIETHGGGPAHVDPLGDVWRAFDFVPGAQSLDCVDTPARARAAARAFGAFVTDLADLPGEISDPLPGFHDFAARSRQFEEAVARDAAGRARAAWPEVERLRAARERLADLLPADALASLPRRLVHNDCKINNVLFDAQTGEALCVIDLDTVMRGSVLFDFGDLVRTAATRAPEDCPDPETVRPDPDLYAALADGYLEGAGGILDAAEIERLPLAGPLITLETGLRFASDHLDGDVYFRVSREDQNRDRARAQATLAHRLLDELDAARARISRAAARRPR